MFKLLTEEEKKKVAHEYHMRRSIVMLLAITFVLFVSIIAILPSYVFSNARLSEAVERARIMGNLGMEGDDETNIHAWLTLTNKKIKVLKPVLDIDRPSDFVDKVLEDRRVGIHLLNFSWVKSDGKTALEIRGVASSRQSLVAFEESIKSSGYFSEVVLPISNLAQDREIDFQIKFLLNHDI